MRELKDQRQQELNLLKATLLPYMKHWDSWTKDERCFLKKEEITAVEFFIGYYTGHGEDEEIKRMQMMYAYREAMKKLQHQYMDFLIYMSTQ